MISPITPKSLAVGIALAMLMVTGWQVYQFWQTESGRALPITAAETIHPSGLETSVPDVPLAELPLFGTALSGQRAPTPDTEDLPETNLRLVLRGALATGSDFPGSALVEDAEGNTEVYLVGDTLPGDALLRTVLPGRIILEREGKLENLYFPEAERQADSALARKQTPKPTANPQPSSDRPATTNRSDEQARREEIEERLQQLRQRLQDTN